MEGMERLSVGEAASRLGISEGAVRKRLARGTLRSEHEAGRVWVLLPERVDAGQPAGQDDRDALIEELRDRVRSLEEANRENRRIIAGLVSRVPELEAPRDEQDEREPGGQDAGQDEAPRRRSRWREFFGFE